MKTQILRLETHDTVTSICDKLTWAQSQRILLAFPRRRPPLLSRLDLTLIQRETARVGSQLAITTRDLKIIDAAAMAGIPVFNSIPEAQRRPWLSRANRPPRTFQRREQANFLRLKSDRKAAVPHALPDAFRGIAFSLGVAAFLAMIALFLPTATLEIPLTPQTQHLDLTVYPGVGVPGVLPGGQLPALTIQTIAAGQLETAASGEILVPDQFAQVLVTFTNLTRAAVTIPQGTRVLAPGPLPQRFLTLTEVEVGAGQQTEVQARAEAAGAAGNVPAGAINAVESPIGLQLTVVNGSTAEGGSDRPASAASDQDYAQLYDRLLTSLTAAALSQSIAENQQSMVIPESLAVSKVLGETRQPSAGQPTDRLNLSLTVEFSVLAVDREDLNTAATAALDARLPRGYLPSEEALTVTQKEAWVVLPGQRITLDISAKRAILPEMNTSQVFAAIRGLTPQEAAQTTQSRLQLSQPPVIRTTPAWWPRLPLLPFRIRVVTS